MGIGRNDPCHCGSGLKYKKCCLQKEVAAAPRKVLDFAYEANLALRGRAMDKVDQLLSETAFQDQIEEFLEDIWIAQFLDEKEIQALRQHPKLQDFIARMFPLALRHAFILYEVPPVRRLLESFPDRFTSEERRFLRDFDAARLTYVQFREFFPAEVYCLAEDIFDGTLFTIHDKSLSREATLHSIASARLVPLPGKAGHVFEAVANSYIPPHLKPTLLELLEPEALDFAQAETGKAEGTPVTPQDYLALLKGDPIVFYWMELFILHHALLSGPPQVRNTDGEKLVFMTGRFACPDPAALRDELAGQRNFERHPGAETETWAWLNTRKMALGTLAFEPGGQAILVETNSRERFRKWEKKLATLGIHALLEKREQPLAAALEEHEPQPKGVAPVPLSAEQMRELAPQMESFFAEAWLKEKIPALDGKTPLQAAKTPAGRKQLLDLFDYMEHQTARLPKGMLSGGFDLDRMRKRLGLPER